MRTVILLSLIFVSSLSCRNKKSCFGNYRNLHEWDFSVPESTAFDPATGDLYISNLGAYKHMPDIKGFIARLAWNQGTNSVSRQVDIVFSSGSDYDLRAPKALVIDKGLLYVADVDTLRVFDLASKEQLQAIYIEGAKDLNGMALSPDGLLLITDMLGKSLIEVTLYDKGGQRLAEPAIKKTFIAYSLNGVTYSQHHDAFILVSWEGEGIFRFSDGNLTKLDVDRTFGALDGVAVDSDGRIYISHWNGGNGQLIQIEGSATKTIANCLGGPADLGFGFFDHQLIIPEFTKNRVSYLNLAQAE